MKGFLDHLIDYRIFLGSRSPRRKQLLEQLGITFQVWLKDEVEETFSQDEEMKEVAIKLAKAKASVYSEDLSKTDLLITADTLVGINGEIMGKPSNESEAFQMLSRLSGHEHEVTTGVCMMTIEHISLFSATTVVCFEELLPSEISYYIEQFSPFDKAGSYGIQEWIGAIGVKWIKGSYFNVMGLPVQKLYQEMKSLTNYKP